MRVLRAWVRNGISLSIQLLTPSGQNMHDEDLCNIFAKLTIKHAPGSGLRPAIKLKTRGAETRDARFQNLVGTIEVKLSLDRFRKVKLKLLRSLDPCQGCNRNQPVHFVPQVSVIPLGQMTTDHRIVALSARM